MYIIKEEMESEKQQIEYFSDDSSSEEEYEKCDHKYKMRTKGHKTCLSCGLEEKYLTKVSEEGYESRMYLKDAGIDHIAEIREKMRETMSMMIYGPHNSFCPDPEEPEYLEFIDHQMTKLPDEFYEWLEELCQVCNEYKLPDGHLWKKVKRGSPIHCRTRSLCAAVLWEKVKSLYPMSMAEFAERVGVSKPTIINTCKKMRQIDLN